jgi:hypothetical protein
MPKIKKTANSCRPSILFCGHYTQYKIDGRRKFVSLQKYFLILSISVEN